MDGRLSLLFLIILGIICLFTDAVEITDASNDVLATKINSEMPITEIKPAKFNSNKDTVYCTLCEEYASLALDYLSQNKTQTEIIDSLTQACSRLKSFQQQCILLVDYYAPFFFLEIETLDPKKFCTKVNLCGASSYIPRMAVDDTCGICNDAISEFLVKLEDPETELEIIEGLLNLCNKVEQYTQQCKTLVFEYGPLILTNAGKYIQNLNICKLIHACNEDIAAKSSSQAII
ncbi:Saposin B domain-containing protein [Zostera marina]|uniref:Pulmonary surfactant-associated protein B n=1 Tax=Zostera marina TaxID=29655 RepID=A0A0K9NVV9_ZOSMR|nr:Saposin B domain-containing protein [Zostera marina]